jgi:O-antigen/teichoic acid export membrane protein
LRTAAPGQERQSHVDAERSAAAGGAILVARFAAGAVLNYAFGVGLAWLLVPAEFGVISAVQNVLLLAAGLLNAGLPWALAIRIAETHGDHEAAKPEFRTALIANLGFGLLLGSAFMATQLAGPRLVPTGSGVLDLLVAVEMPMLAVNGTLAGAAQGSRRFGGLGAMQAGEILLKCAIAAVLVAGLHAGPAGIALSFFVGTAGSVLIGLRTCRGLLPGRGPLASLSFLATSGSIWFASASMTFLITADLLGLAAAGQAAGVTAAVLAGYQACGLLAKASFYVSDALADAVFPFMARSVSRQDKHHWFLAAARWVPLLIVPIQAALFAAPGPVLRTFLPHHYSAAHALLQVLAAGTLGALMTDMLMKSLFATGYGRQAGRLMPVAAVTEVIGLIIFVPRYGALGAAYSYLLASYVGVILLGLLHLKAFGARLPSLRQLAAYAAGFAPTAAVFTVAGHAPTLLAWVLLAIGTLLFIIPARRMRLITDADVSFLTGRCGRRGQALLGAWTRSGERRAAWRAESRLAVFCACVAAVAMLYNIFASPDVLYDEAVYTYAAQQVAQGWHLTLGNQPMFVHPPLMFLAQGAWLRLTGQATAPLASGIRTARLLAASVGAADVLLIAGLGYRLASGAGPRQRRVLTGLIAVIAALDPVLTRYDRQDVIEPFALCIGLLTLHAAWQLRDRGALAYVSVTGLLGGLALLTNEITICLVIVPPLFALLEWNRPLLRRSLAALGIAIAFLLLFLVWAAELGLAGSFISIQDSTLRRIVGLEQITGFNVPGVSLLSALGRSVGEYASSYIVLAAGAAALVWCWSRRNTPNGNFLAAWLTASYAAGCYIVAVGTLNEQFFVYLLPAGIVGSVLFADALLASWVRRLARTRVRRDRPGAGSSRWPLVITAVGCAGLVGLSAVSWVSNYSDASDGVALADRFIATTLPACAAVNVSGDLQKYSYLQPGRSFSYFSVGAAALADGVHYFLLSPVDATEEEGNMSPALESWIRSHGQRLVIFPSQVFKTVQLWHVPASPYDPAADVTDIAGGIYVNTASSDCGGHTVTNGPGGSSFYSAYQARGGKAVLGDPLSQPADSGRSGREQFFDGMVLAVSPSGRPAVRPLPIVATLAKDSPAAYRRALLPPVYSHASAAERRGWLANPAITHAYLGGKPMTQRSYAAAVQRYGEPLGPPVALPGNGISQAFADVVLEAPGRGGSVHAAAVTPIALAAGLLRVPAQARVPRSPPPLPNPFPPGPTQPTSVAPFVATLGAALLLYAGAVAVLARRRRGPQSLARGWRRSGGTW